MGSVVVDQIGADGQLVADVDTTLTEREKTNLLLAALPGATAERIAGVSVVRFEDQVIFKKQVTYLGTPWPVFKKRIQIPKTWVEGYRAARQQGLHPRFIGIYRYGDVTIYVDFDPTTYVERKANNSAAHVWTNDLHQAQTDGVFSREDHKGNRLTSLREDQFAGYLRGSIEQHRPRLDVFARFNAEFLHGARLEALDAVREMFEAAWPDTFQGEWPGFYLEYRLDKFLRANHLQHLVTYQKDKGKGRFDYDLMFPDGLQVDYYGDLKASNILSTGSPGNDAESLRRCVAEYGRFWYVIYEHETWHGRDEGDRPTIAWNEWKRSVGHANGKEYDALSYSSKFKSAVRFARMRILELNEANFGVVLSDFKQGRQPDGAARALKVMIAKKNIDNFLIFSATAQR